jgi:hypothetical protein
MFANPNKQYLVGALRVVVDRLTFGRAIATSRSSGQIAVALPKAYRPSTANPAPERRTFGGMPNPHKPFVWSRHWNPGYRQPPGELSRTAKRCLAPKETRYASCQQRLQPHPGSRKLR